MQEKDPIAQSTQKKKGKKNIKKFSNNPKQQFSFSPKQQKKSIHRPLSQLAALMSSS
jgi:hypothetical protein